MCSGHRVLYTCCGFTEWVGMRRCSIISPDYPVQHRIIGLAFRTTRLCRRCERQRVIEEQRQATELRRWQERAKALTDYWQGRRSWPLTDDEIVDRYIKSYRNGQRLHPWVNHGVPGIDDVDPLWPDAPTAFDNEYRETRGARAGEGRRLFQEMLDRQADIDRTGRPMTEDDRRFLYPALCYFPTERERDESSHQSEAPSAENDAHDNGRHESPRNDPSTQS